MARKTTKMIQITQNSNEISQFANVAENAKPVTQPSILLKGGMEEIQLTRLTPKEIEQYLWMHPAIPRGIEIKANRMTSRGYRIEPFDNSKQAKDAANKMWELLKNSGGEILLNGWIQDTYAFGNGYLTLLQDKNTGEIVLLSKEHPVFFRIARNKKEKDSANPTDFLSWYKPGDFTYEWGTMKIDEVTKKPKAYTQVIFEKGSRKEVTPIGEDIPAEKVAHLVFDTWGDEAEGISIIQYTHLILKYLMNIEEAGAEATWRSGFTQKVVQTNVRNENDLKKVAKNLEKINAKDAIITPEGTTVTNLTPGQHQFVEVHDRFLTLLAIRLGIPKPILVLDGTDTNKATIDELVKDMIYDIRAEEIKIKRTIEEQIFKRACESIYGADFEKIPAFFFNDFVASTEQRAESLKITAEYVKTFTEAYATLANNGQDAAAQHILKFMLEKIDSNEMTGLDEKPKEKTEEEIDVQPRRPETPKPTIEEKPPTEPNLPIGDT